MSFRRAIRSVIVGVAAIFWPALPFGVNAAESANKTPGAFIIRNVRIFDGEKVIAANSIVVVGGKIAAVGANLRLRRTSARNPARRFLRYRLPLSVLAKKLERH